MFFLMCRSQCSAVSGPSELCLRHSGGQCQTHMQSSTRCSHRKPKWCEESEGGGRRNGGRRITSFPPKGKSVFTKISETTLTVAQTCFFYRTFSSAYLFQDGFSHWGLVSKTAQKELERLDGEVGVEGEVSHNVRGKALGNTYKKRTRGVRRLLQRQNGYVRVPRVYLL